MMKIIFEFGVIERQHVVNVSECVIKCSCSSFVTLLDKILYKLSFIGIKKQIGKKWCTISPHWNANCLLVDLSTKLNKYIIYQEIHHKDYVIFSNEKIAIRLQP